jgi:hypothetical protein
MAKFEYSGVCVGRWTALVVACLAKLAAGSVFVFNVYSVPIKKIFHYSQSQGRVNLNNYNLMKTFHLSLSSFNPSFNLSYSLLYSQLDKTVTSYANHALATNERRNQIKESPQWE